jgi:general secretion pathway protein I
MKNSEAPARAAQGFTLLEVVVALAVVSLGIIAAFNLIVQISSGSLHMKEKTFAGWIASNEITRLRISGEFPDVSQFDGDVEFAGSQYRWRATISETGVKDLRRIDMDVAYADDPDAVVGRSVGFISPPTQPQLGGAEWTRAADSGPGSAEDLNGDDQGDNQGDNQNGTADGTPAEPTDAGDQGTQEGGQ